MQNIYALANKSEQLYNNKKNIKRGFNFLFRCYEIYIFNDDSKALEQGLLRAKEILNENKQSISISLMCAFFETLKGDYENADKRLDVIKKYTKYIKNNDSDNYSFYLYIRILSEFLRSKGRISFKYLKSLRDCKSSYGCIFLAHIYILIKNDHRKIGELLQTAYNNKNRSRMFFMVLLSFYNYRKENNPFTELLIPLFRWGLVRKVNLSNIIEANADKISLSFFESLQLFIKLYKVYPENKILSEIIKALMNNFDYSESAYYFYKEAMIKQMSSKKLIYFFIKTSYKLDIEDIGVYPIQKYLSFGNIDEEIKVFIYHIILNDERFRDILENYEYEIVKYGLNAFAMKRLERYYFSIYKFITDKAEKFKISDTLCLEIFKLLAPYSFVYEVKTDNKKAAFIRIKQKDINKMIVYPIKNGNSLIKALNENFTAYLFDSKNKEILTGQITYKKMIQNSDYNFYLNLYKKDYTDENIVLFLAKYFSEYYDAEALNILLSAYSIKNISRNLKMKIAFKLGNIFYSRKEKDKALYYFKEIDLNYINGKNAERLMQIFAENNELQLAVNVLIKKSNSMSDKVVFYAVRKIAEDKSFYSSINIFAYNLLMKKYYDKSFIEIVNENFIGGIDEWTALRVILDEMEVPDKKIDERILNLSILTHKLNNVIEKVFYCVYNNAPESTIIKAFVDFICYEVIIENKNINLKTILTLEEEFLKYENYVVAAALSNIYINQCVTTDNFYDIIEKIKYIFEKNGISFPNFSQIKDKAFHNAYIDKYRAFYYKSSVGKNVYMHYRRSGSDKFIKRKMKYFKFGLYILCINVFFGEKIEYYFSEQMKNGNIQTSKAVFFNKDEVLDFDYKDDFFEINSAFISQTKGEYDFVENFILSRLSDDKDIKGRLL